MRTFNERNELSVNNNRSFIDNPNLFLMTRFIQNQSHYQTIFVIIFCRKTSFIKIQSSQDHLNYNFYINTIPVATVNVIRQGRSNQVGKEVMMFHFTLRWIHNVISKQFTVSHRKTLETFLDICLYEVQLNQSLLFHKDFVQLKMKLTSFLCAANLPR